MALTYDTAPRVEYEGNMRVWYGSITFDSSYPTGGEALSLASLGFSRQVFSVVAGPTTTGHVGVWDLSKTAPKLLAFIGAGSAALAEVSNGTNLSTAVFPCVIRGI